MRGGDTSGKAGRHFPCRTDFGTAWGSDGSIVIWTVPYQQFSTDRQRSVGFVDSSSTVNGKHRVWKATTLIEGGKNKSSQWADLHDVFPAGMRKLNSGISPDIWLFIDSWAVANGLAIRLGRRAMKTWAIKGTPVGDMALWKSLYTFEECTKVGQGDVLKRTFFQLWNVIRINCPCLGHLGPWNEQNWGHNSSAEMG